MTVDLIEMVQYLFGVACRRPFSAFCATDSMETRKTKKMAVFWLLTCRIPKFNRKACGATADQRLIAETASRVESLEDLKAISGFQFVLTARVSNS
jgi:hypothetical protein